MHKYLHILYTVFLLCACDETYIRRPIPTTDESSPSAESKKEENSPQLSDKASLPSASTTPAKPSVQSPGTTILSLTLLSMIKTGTGQIRSIAIDPTSKDPILVGYSRNTAPNYAMTCRYSGMSSTIHWENEVGNTGSTSDFSYVMGSAISGNKVFITGQTNGMGISSNAIDPTFGGGFQEGPYGVNGYDAFFAVLDLATGQTLYSTYLGTTSNELGRGLTVLTNGQVAITSRIPANSIADWLGNTAVVNPGDCISTTDCAMVVVMDPPTYDRGSIVFPVPRTLSIANTMNVNSIASDPKGGFYHLTGEKNLGTVVLSHVQNNLSVEWALFVNDKKSIIESNNLDVDLSTGIAYTSHSSALFTGTPGSYQVQNRGGLQNKNALGDLGVAGYSPTGQLLFATNLGGTMGEEVGAIKAINYRGNSYVVVVGDTLSSDFPFTTKSQLAGAFISIFSADLSQLLLSENLSTGGKPRALAFDALAETLYVGGHDNAGAGWRLAYRLETRNLKY